MSIPEEQAHWAVRRKASPWPLIINLLVLTILVIACVRTRMGGLHCGSHEGVSCMRFLDRHIGCFCGDVRSPDATPIPTGKL